MNTQQLYELFQKHPNIQTDTRKLKAGDLFFALSGPNHNGNSFAIQAIELGAAYAIVDEEIENENGQIIRVNNVLQSLQLLAKYHREQFNIPFIAITGSNGKTTTKELVNSVLSSYYRTYTTHGNLNNHIGIPLTLLQVKKDAEFAVIEMGANHQKEIEDYCTYVQPTYGIITNCGKAHLEGFGGLEGVRKGKGELFDYLRTHAGHAFIFNDFPYLKEMAIGIRTITYGTEDASITGNATTISNFLQVALTSEEGTPRIQTQLVGDYNLPNVLCAVCIGKHFKVPLEKIINAIEDYAPGNSRSQMHIKGTNHIILDAYNANPSSMKVAIENFAAIEAEKKVLMLGAMMELGDHSISEHRNVVEIIEKYQWVQVLLVGTDFQNVNHSFNYFSNSIDAANWVKTQNFTHTFILIKGSRSMQMEKIADVI